MKFEVKKEPVCAVLVAVPTYVAIVINTLGTGVRALDAWFPLSVVVTVLIIAISFVTMGNNVKEEPQAPGRKGSREWR